MMTRPAAHWTGLTRRTFLTGAIATAGAGVPALAAGQVGAQRFPNETLRVQFWAGPEGQAIQKHVVDPFSKESGVRVLVEFGNTVESIAKVRAQKGDPKIDIFMMDDIGVVTTDAEGLLETLDLANVPNVLDLHPRFIYANGRGLGIGVNVNSALWYHKPAFPQPPTSREVFFDPKYTGKVALPPVSLTAGLYTLINIARMRGGSQYDIDPAFKALEELKAKIHSFPQNAQLLGGLLDSGEVMVAGFALALLRPYLVQGYKIDVNTAPKEGICSAPPSIALIKGHKAKREVAEAFINKVLSPEAQAGISTETWWGPTNKKAKLPEEVAKRVISTQEQYDRIMPVDLNHLLTVRQQWIERYTRTIAK
jgi:putative spermidine/putrescine transport system substrate-binding protein